MQLAVQRPRRDTPDYGLRLSWSDVLASYHFQSTILSWDTVATDKILVSEMGCYQGPGLMPSGVLSSDAKVLHLKRRFYRGFVYLPCLISACRLSC
jgi:hypothetical protein